MTYQFSMFNEMLNKTNWYLYPAEMQRMLVIFISITQEPSFIRGYGNIECTRDSFKQVKTFSVHHFLSHLDNHNLHLVFFLFLSNNLNLLKTANGGFSYFMMLHQINSV